MASQENNQCSEQPSQPPLCACGFFGNPANNNLCSKCYREQCSEHERQAKQEQQIAETIAAATAPSKPANATEEAQSAATTPEAATAAVAEAAVESSQDAKPVQLNTSRCFDCNKRIGLTGFKCRCGYVYCATHRYAEKHNCTFDYKSAGRQTLSAANPVVAAAKVQKL